MSKKRRHHTPQEKVMILKKNLLENGSVSDVCDEYNIHPTLFYREQKEFFEKGSMVFEKEKGSYF
ncbi:transposase [Desulfothermus naphthae]